MSRPNVLVLLADDLGYGDLSVQPFVGNGIPTPSLEHMATQSVVLTNFHVAAPVCTPSRAAILTGLFPHRLGIEYIFGSGPQANEHLTVLPNVANIFKAEGYHTAHVGKWHLGGMRPQDVRARQELKRALEVNGTHPESVAMCPTPGINQHGFKEYIAMEEGHGSIRFQKYVHGGGLYSNGAKHLVRNDEPHDATDEDLTLRQGKEVSITPIYPTSLRLILTRSRSSRFHAIVFQKGGENHRVVCGAW